MKKLSILILALLLSMLLFGCGSDNDDKTPSDSSVSVISTENTGDFVLNTSLKAPPGKPKEKTIIVSAILDEDGNPIKLNPGDFSLKSAGTDFEPITALKMVKAAVPSGKFSVTPLTDGGSKVDIVYAIDSTGSMNVMITDVKNSIESFAKEFEDSGVDVKFAGVAFWDKVGYDLGDDPINIDDAIFNRNLTKGADDFTAWLGELYATGGNDIPEVSVDAIYELAARVQWRSGAQRIIIGITDAQSHQRGCGDVYTDDKEFALWTAEETINKCMGNTTVYTFSPEGRTSRTVAMLLKDNKGNLISNKGEDPTPHTDISVIAQGTGGKDFQWTGGPLNLAAINLSESILSGYEIGFTDVKTGRHFIEITVRTPGGKTATSKIEVSN